MSTINTLLALGVATLCAVSGLIGYKVGVFVQKHRQ